MLFEGKTALVTGAAHGQGRGHAVRLAEEGADIILLDVCAPAAQVSYEMGTWEELQETLRLVESFDRRGHIAKVDVRDRVALEALRDDTAEEFPEIDIIVANAGITSYSRLLDVSPSVWDEIIGVNLTGVFNVVQLFAPRMIAHGRGGSIVITSSVAGTKALPFCGPYTAAKHGVQGLSHAFAQELGPHGIRVNTVNPGPTMSPMSNDDSLDQLFDDTRDDSTWFVSSMNPILPFPESGRMEAVNVTEAVVYLASDHAKFVTGAVIPVDGGITVR